MIQKPIRLSWLDWFAYDSLRKRRLSRWIWRRFFARKHALHNWQTVIVNGILWEHTIGRNENQLVAVVASWLYKAVRYWHPDGPKAAIDLILDTIYRRLGWFAVKFGPTVVPECFPAILKAATESALYFADSGSCLNDAVFKADMRKRLQA